MTARERKFYRQGYNAAMKARYTPFTRAEPGRPRDPRKRIAKTRKSAFSELRHGEEGNGRAWYANAVTAPLSRYPVRPVPDDREEGDQRLNRSGTSRRMATDPASLSMSGITAHITIETGENEFSLSGQEKRSCLERQLEMPSLFGESSKATISPDSPVYAAPSSETKEASSPQSLSDRLTPSLISARLVKGTTPMSVRRKLGAVIQDFAFSWLDGESAEQPKVAC